MTEDAPGTRRTHVTLVLDASGSMAKIEADTIGGYNTLLDEQDEEPGPATVSLYEFDTSVRQVSDPRPIETATRLSGENYSPGGQTALHDALSQAIDETATYISSLDAEETPDSVIVVVLTDGRENTSETPAELVRERVQDKREQAGWEFLFIGANQDTALAARELGMDADKSLDMAHTGDGARAAYEATSRSLSRARRKGQTGGYDDRDRRRQDQADATRAKQSEKESTAAHEDVAAIPGLNPFHVCETCKLAAVRAVDLREYPCDPSRYDPDEGGSQQEKLREERLAWDILKLGDGSNIDVPSSRADLESDAQEWLEEVERDSTVIADQPEDEKLRVAAQWASESWATHF